MATLSFRNHPALQFWPSLWTAEDDGLATILVIRSKGAFVLWVAKTRGTSVATEIFRWAKGTAFDFTNLTKEQNEVARNLVLDGSAWLEIWTLWPWGWRRDTTTQPCNPPPTASSLDEAARTLVPDLPQGLPLIPSRWIPQTQA